MRLGKVELAQLPRLWKIFKLFKWGHGDNTELDFANRKISERFMVQMHSDAFLPFKIGEGSWKMLELPAVSTACRTTKVLFFRNSQRWSREVRKGFSQKLKMIRLAMGSGLLSHVSFFLFEHLIMFCFRFCLGYCCFFQHVREQFLSTSLLISFAVIRDFDCMCAGPMIGDRMCLSFYFTA